MIETVKQLKEQRPDLVKDFEVMIHEQLLNQIYLEVIDAINMEERVETFMELCTPNMSKTTYTPEAIRELINLKQEQDTTMFCEIMLQDIEGMNVKEIKKYLKSEIRE